MAGLSPQVGTEFGRATRPIASAGSVVDVPTPIKALNSGPLYMEWFSFLFFLSLCTRISSEISRSGDGKTSTNEMTKLIKSSPLGRC